MSKETVAVLGGGNGAHAMAGDLSLRGFDVSLFEFPEFASNVEPVLESERIEVEGVIEGTAELECASTDVDEVLAGAKYVNVVVPAFAHSRYASLLDGRLDDDQVVTLFPGALGSLELAQTVRSGPDGSDVTLAEVDNLPYDTRLVEPGRVRILDRNPVSIGFLPANRSRDVLDAMPDFYDFEFCYEDVLECGLSIINPALHSGACVINVGQIEYWADGDFHLYEEGFTPSAAKLDVKLEAERSDIGAALGYELTAFENFADLDEDWTWKDLYREVHGHIGLTPIEGPNDIEDRYLTEDAPYGLVTWSTIGDVVGVETPLIDGIVTIYNTIHERDWWEEGRTAADLGLAGKTSEEIREYVQTGVEQA
jgi:opine dehydrogenase